MLGAALLVLAALLAAWLVGQRTALLEEQGSQLRAKAEVVERNVARQLETAQAVLRQLSGVWGTWPETERAKLAADGLSRMAETQAGLRTLSLLDRQGRVLASSRPELLGRDFSDRAYFRQARDAADPGRAVLTPPFLTALGVYSMNLALPLRDAQGSFQGVVTATLDPDYFDLLLRTTNMSPDAFSGLVHASGTVAIVRPEDPRFEGRDVNLPGSLFRRHLDQGQDQSYFAAPLFLTGERHLIAYANVRPSPWSAQAPLVVAVSRNEAAVLAPWNRLAGSVLGLAGLLLGVAGAGLFWVQRAEHQAAEGLDRLERIGQTAPGVICQFVLWPDGHAAVPFATRALDSYFGVPTSGTPGSADALFSHIDPAQVDRVRDAILASAQTLQPFHEEFLMQVPGQPERWLDVHSLPQRKEDGSTVWTGLVMDATGVRQARESQLMLQAAQRTSDAKSEFLSRASHELRTPLNAVIGFSSLLLTHPSDPLKPSQREQLGYIHDAGQHLLALINDLLDVSAIESGRVQAVISDVPVAPLLGEVLSTVREQASAAGVQLQTQVPADSLVARADRLRLKQVLLNLLSNAIKYNHRGGTVRVVLMGVPGQTVDISVQDTGPGLTETQRAHLFEPFNRLGAEVRGIQGTGIGLTIARMLVELMNGSIRVDSVLGQGSSFVVQLQASAVQTGGVVEPGAPTGAPPWAAPLSGPAPAADAPRLQVLYAEDNAMNALFVEQLLALRPHMQLHVATSGAQALQLARRLHPGLVLLDLHLGDMSGFDVLAALQADPATAGLRCAALTADALPATADRARAAGFVDFITKPVDIHRLLRLVDDAAAGLEGRPAVEEG